MSIFHNNALIGASSSKFQILRSLRFNSFDSADLSRTPTVNSTSTTIFTVSVWVKRCTIAAGTAAASGRQTIFYTGVPAFTGNMFLLEWNDDSIACLFDAAGTYYPKTVAKFRDVSSWYHIVAAVDTTQVTPANRCRIYVNGVEQTSLTGTQPVQNHAVVNGTTSTHRIGGASTYYSNMYATELFYINNQQLTPSSFGENDGITGVWGPKTYTGSFVGANSCYIKFQDNSNNTATTLGADYSGNGNNFTPNNFVVTAGVNNDSVIDTPLPYVGTTVSNIYYAGGNYCTINSASHLTTVNVRNGNLQYSSSSNGQTAVGTQVIGDGAKWYFEVLTTGGTTQTQVGLYNVNTATATTLYALTTDNITFGFRYDAGSFDVTTDGFNYTQIAFVGNAEWLPYFRNNGALAKVVYINFGQRPFVLSQVSTNYVGITTANLATPDIIKPTDRCSSFLYTGNAANRSFTGLPNYPALVWIKGRSGATDHALYDYVRGATLDLAVNTTAAQTTQATGLTSFDFPNGFSIGTLAKLNTNTATYIAWWWDALNLPAQTIVTYTGNGTSQFISHNLLGFAEFIIVKSTSAVGNWAVFHTALGGTKYLLLNGAGAATVSAAYWNNAAPDFSSFQVGTSADTNANGVNYIAYCFRSYAGFSKFSSYTGNGNAEGPYVHLGFEPAFVMIKNTTTAGVGWVIIDSTRNNSNPITNSLSSSSNLQENGVSATNTVDFTSNGFKIRTTQGNYNTSANVYAYIAFAEVPTKYALAR